MNNLEIKRSVIWFTVLLAGWVWFFLLTIILLMGRILAPTSFLPHESLGYRQIYFSLIFMAFGLILMVISGIHFSKKINPIINGVREDVEEEMMRLRWTRTVRMTTMMMIMFFNILAIVFLKF